MGHFKKVCMSKRNHTIHEEEVEVMTEPQEERYRNSEYKFNLFK